MTKDGIKGLQELGKSLKRLEQNTKALEGQHEVPFSELFPPNFMRRHTNVSSFEELLEASPYIVESKEDFGRIPDEPWDEYIRGATGFSSWREMMQAAAGEYAKKTLLTGTVWKK